MQQYVQYLPATAHSNTHVPCLHKKLKQHVRALAIHAHHSKLGHDVHPPKEVDIELGQEGCGCILVQVIVITVTHDGCEHLHKLGRCQHPVGGQVGG